MRSGRARTVRPDMLFAAAGGGALLLLLLLALELRDGFAAAEPVANAPPALAAGRGTGDGADPALSPSALPSAAAVNQNTGVVLARPLFTPQRRPPAAVAAGPQQPRLAGIIAGPAGRRAIFAGDGDARGTVVGVGGQAGAWHVVAINDHDVRVDGPDGARVLHPARDRSGGAGGGGLPGDDSASHPSILDLLRSRTGAHGGGLMGGQLPSPQNGGQFLQQTAPAAPE